jgi:hypothetical protein
VDLVAGAGHVVLGTAQRVLAFLGEPMLAA